MLAAAGRRRRAARGPRPPGRDDRGPAGAPRARRGPAGRRLRPARRHPRPRRTCGRPCARRVARPAGHDALDALRVEALRPWYGPDVTEENLLHETGLVAECHSSAKGCYVGQEVVARLEARGGHVNKALRGLRLSAAGRGGRAVAVDGQGGRPGHHRGRVAAPRARSPSPTSTATTSPPARPSRWAARPGDGSRPSGRRGQLRPGTRREDLHEDGRPRRDGPARRDCASPRTTCGWPPTATWTS